MAAGDDRGRTGTLPKHRLLDVLRSGVLGWLPWPALDLNRKRHPVVAFGQEQRARELVNCFREKRAPASHIGAAAGADAGAGTSSPRKKVGGSGSSGGGGDGGDEVEEKGIRGEDLEEKEEVPIVGGRPFGPACYLDLIAFLIVDATTGTTVDSNPHQVPLKLPKIQQQGPQGAAEAGHSAATNGNIGSSSSSGGNGDGGIGALALLPARARGQTLGLDPLMQQHLLELHRNLASIPRSPTALQPPRSSSFSSSASSSSSFNPDSPYMGGLAGASTGHRSGGLEWNSSSSSSCSSSARGGGNHHNDSFSPWLPITTDAAAGTAAGNANSSFGGQHVVDPAHFPHASSAPGTLTISMAPYVDRRTVGGGVVSFLPSTANDELKRKETAYITTTSSNESHQTAAKPSLYDPKYPPKVPHPASVLPSSAAPASLPPTSKQQQRNPILSEALVDLEIDRGKDDLTTAAQVYRSRANKQKQLNLYLLAHAASGVERSTDYGVPPSPSANATAVNGGGGRIDASTGLRALYRPQNSEQRVQSVPAGPGIGGDIWGDGAGGIGSGPAASADFLRGHGNDGNIGERGGREGEGGARYLPVLDAAAATSMPRQMSAPMLGPPGPPSSSLSYSPMRGGHAAAGAGIAQPHSAADSMSGHSLELVSVRSVTPSEVAPGGGGGSLDGSSSTSTSVDSLAVGSIVWDEWAKDWAPIGGHKSNANSSAPPASLDPLLRGRHAQQTALKQQQVQAKRRAVAEAKAAKQALQLAEREEAKNKQQAAERAIMAALSVRDSEYLIRRQRIVIFTIYLNFPTHKSVCFVWHDLFPCIFLDSLHYLIVSFPLILQKGEAIKEEAKKAEIVVKKKQVQERKKKEVAVKQAKVEKEVARQEEEVREKKADDNRKQRELEERMAKLEAERLARLAEEKRRQVCWLGCARINMCMCRMLILGDMYSFLLLFLCVQLRMICAPPLIHFFGWFQKN